MASSSDRIVLSDDRDTVKRLRHVGRKLSKNLASSVDKLLDLLDKLELVLTNLDQDPAKPIQESLVLPMKTLISDELLRHTDDDVKISVTACLTEIARITAPNAPYNDEHMKEYLKLTVDAFEKLSGVCGRGYEKAITILEIFSKIKIYLIMLDLDCDDLVIEMFQNFLRVIRPNHPSNVIESMEIVMTGILDESEDISSVLVRPLLDSVRKENQTISPITWTLGEKVITNCAVKLKTHLMQAVESSGRALDEYAQIIISICKNQSVSPEHNHSTAVVENSLDVTKDANEEPCDVTKGLQTDNTCARDVQTIDDTQLNIRSKISTTMDGGVAECDGSKSNPHSSFIQNSELGISRTSTGNFETVQKLSSETELDTVPRKRTRKPNSLMNPDECYDHSWIYKESGTEKSSRSKKACDNGHTVTPSDDPTSIKDKKHSSSKTVSKALVCKVNNGKIKKPAQSIKTFDKGSDFPSTKVRKGSEVKHEANIRNFKLSIKIDGKVLVPPKSIVSPMNPEVLCEDVGKLKSSTNVKVGNLEEGRTAAQRRRQTAPSDKGFNESSAMKACEPQDLGNSLVGKRIKVRWPLDKIYYEGLVDAYDHVKGKHKILYDDGDTEQLNLKKERWELLDVSLDEEEDFGLRKLAEASAIAEKNNEESKLESLVG